MRKYDINLIPRKTGTSDVAKLALSMGLLALVMALLLAVGVLYPKMILQFKQQQKAELLSQASTYDNVHQQFTDTTGQLKQIKGQIDNLDSFRQYNNVLGSMLSTLEQCSPDSLTLTSIRAAYDKIDCSGTALRDEDVAAFAAKLRETGMFASVEIVSTEGDNTSRTFNISMIYPVSENAAKEANAAASANPGPDAVSEIAQGGIGQ